MEIKNIVIVGASSGIGLALAEAYLSQGHKLGLAARRTDALQKLAQKFPGQVEVEVIDVDSDDAPRLLSVLADRMGGMDLYIHVAGIGAGDCDLEPNTQARVIETNAGGLARMTSVAFNFFRCTGRPGQIAAITSIAGTKGIGQMAAYSASKKCASAFLLALRQLACAEGLAITITDIRPGWIRTPLLNDGSRYPLESKLDEVVPLIVRAIRRRRNVAVIGWRWRVIVALWRLLPNWLWVRMRFPMTLSGSAF